MSSEPINFNVAFILEVLGRPKEHLVDTLEEISKQIDSEKGVNVTSKIIHEPKEIENNPEMFSSFAEIEISINDLSLLINLVFKYMPSLIEIISPERISLSNTDFSDTLNEIARRLHRYDEVVRVMDAEKKILERQLKKE